MLLNSAQRSERRFNSVKSVDTLSFAIGVLAKVNYSLAAYGLYCYLGTFKANTRAECYFKYAWRHRTF